MKIEYSISQKGEYEIVERKGMGHPDTLADSLAEILSNKYAEYTRNNFGAILHHNFDKVGLMGGETKLEFGKYKIVSPIRVLINGRASGKFGDIDIPVREMLEEETKSFLKDRLFGINPDKDLRIIYEVASGSSPGSIGDESNLRNRWFSPLSLDDLSELKKLSCNDTSLGAAFYHRDVVEDCVWKIEQELNSKSFKEKYSWIGSDIKIMACRNAGDLIFTMAIPQLAEKVGTINEYVQNKDFLYEHIMCTLKKYAPEYSIHLDINTRDRIGNSTDLYLTATGSSIEMGDEGFVGRGNRMGGLITPFRPYSMEGICGKNPVYHTGKMYSVAAWEISKKIYELSGEDTNVMIVGQSGRPLEDPWNIVIQGDLIKSDTEIFRHSAEEILKNFDEMTERILRGEYILC